MSREVRVNIWTDGSHSTKKNGVGWGLVIEKPKDPNDTTFKPSIEINGLITNPDLVRQRNVAGEVQAAITALYISQVTGISINLHYDYEGVEKWATGEWRAKSTFSSQYQQIAHAMYQKGLVRFIKIPAHTGIPGNERADKLAKLALDGVVINERYN